MLALALLVLALPVSVTPQATAEAETVKVKIEASEMDRRMLLAKLNEHGAEHRMKFVLDEKEFVYRISFVVDQPTELGSSGSYNTSAARVAVYDDKDVVLFGFARAQRRTDSGATNAAAKEIIKRMLKLKELPRK